LLDDRHALFFDEASDEEDDSLRRRQTKMLTRRVTHVAIAEHEHGVVDAVGQKVWHLLIAHPLAEPLHYGTTDEDDRIDSLENAACQCRIGESLDASENGASVGNRPDMLREQHRFPHSSRTLHREDRSQVKAVVAMDDVAPIDPPADRGSSARVPERVGD